MISTFNLPVHLEFILIYIMRYGLNCVAPYASPLSSGVQFHPITYHPLTIVISSNLPLCVYELLFIFLGSESTPSFCYYNPMCESTWLHASFILFCKNKIFHDLIFKIHFRPFSSCLLPGTLHVGDWRWRIETSGLPVLSLSKECAIHPFLPSFSFQTLLIGTSATCCDHTQVIY